MLKIKIATLMLIAGVLVGGASRDISGTWKIVPKPGSPLMKTVYEPTLVFKVDGDKLTGTAHTENWPGDGTISEGKVAGDRITFTLTHERMYTTNAGTYYATYRCTGTVHGEELDLSMISPNPGLAGLAMKGRGRGSSAIPVSLGEDFL